MASLAFASAAEMLRALRAGEVSAVELVDLLIGRIGRHEAKLNALVVRDFDRARDTARAADAERATGGDRPLLCLPMTVKDNLNVVGLRMTAGLPRGAPAHVPPAGFE